MFRNSLQIIVCALLIIMCNATVTFGAVCENFENNPYAQKVYAADKQTNAFMLDGNMNFDADTSGITSERFVVQFDMLPMQAADECTFLSVDLIPVLSFSGGTLCFGEKYIDDFFICWHHIWLLFEKNTVRLFVDNDDKGAVTFEDDFFGFWVSFEAGSSSKILIDNVSIGEINAAEVAATGFMRYGCKITAPLIGENRLAVTVQNYGNEAICGILYLAKYDSEGCFCGIIAQEEIKAGVNEAVTVWTAFRLEEDDTSEYKYFLWNDVNMTPLLTKYAKGA